jgi:hypothetical protein
MKKLYPTFFFHSLLLLGLLQATTAWSQCPDGQAPGTKAYDTTIRFATGATNMQVKFPKFNPQTGMLSCVKLIVTVIGVVDSVAMQNYSSSPQTADFYYDRSDYMTGPGLTPSLSNTFNGHYGPQTLSTYDGTPNSGADFYSISRDSVLRKVMTRTLTDSTEISQFYGTDSMVYNYNINVSTSAVITGGSSSSLVLTSALVNFRFEYCTCPLVTLPVGLKNFSVSKAGSSSADLRWEAEAGNDNYFYEVEVSRDGRHFQKASTRQKASNGNSVYQYLHPIKSAENGRYYFRVKQRWLDGYFRYTDIKSVDFSNPVFAAISIYPNPTSGNVGIKFVAGKAGLYDVAISNAGGQIVTRKTLKVAATDYKQITNLSKGIYYLKLTEQETQSSCIHQLIVQ